MKIIRLPDSLCQCSRVLLALLAMFFCAEPLGAQSVDGRVVGVIRDASGGLLVGVSVTLSNVGTGEVRTVTTDETGAYRF